MEDYEVIQIDSKITQQDKIILITPLFLILLMTDCNFSLTFRKNIHDQNKNYKYKKECPKIPEELAYYDDENAN